MKTISVSEELQNKVQAFLVEESIALQICDKGDVAILQGDRESQCEIYTLAAGGWIKCQMARDMADKLEIKYGQMGALLDILEIKIKQCGLGCFK